MSDAFYVGRLGAERPGIAPEAVTSCGRETGECAAARAVFAVDKTKGTWCSGITSASHAEDPGFKSQSVHVH